MQLVTLTIGNHFIHFKQKMMFKTVTQINILMKYNWNHMSGNVVDFVRVHYINFQFIEIYWNFQLIVTKGRNLDKLTITLNNFLLILWANIEFHTSSTLKHNSPCIDQRSSRKNETLFTLFSRSNVNSSSIDSYTRFYSTKNSHFIINECITHYFAFFSTLVCSDTNWIF